MKGKPRKHIDEKRNQTNIVLTGRDLEVLSERARARRLTVPKYIYWELSRLGIFDGTPPLEHGKAARMDEPHHTSFIYRSVEDYVKVRDWAWEHRMNITDAIMLGFRELGIFDEDDVSEAA